MRLRDGARDGRRGDSRLCGGRRRRCDLRLEHHDGEQTTPQNSTRRSSSPRAQRAGRQIAGFAAEPALVEFEDRFAELAEAYEAKQVPRDLAVLWTQVFRLAGAYPVGRPSQYGVLVVY